VIFEKISSGGLRWSPDGHSGGQKQAQHRHARAREDWKTGATGARGSRACSVAKATVVDGAVVSIVARLAGIDGEFLALPGGGIT
jgi:hypothetical protein